jgi:hypothetical protein
MVVCEAALAIALCDSYLINNAYKKIKRRYQLTITNLNNIKVKFTVVYLLLTS